MLEQGSEEWFVARCGKITASRVHDVIARTKSGYAASRKNYEAQLIAERLTQTVADSYSNAAMQWGIDTEPQARAAYELRSGYDVLETGFTVHPRIENAGASPDGLIGENGMVEIKCPNTATHLETLLGAKIPAKYVTQMQWQMACEGRLWCDFVSFDPRLPVHLQVFINRMHRDDNRIKELETEVIGFDAEIARKLDELSKQYEFAQ